PETPIAVFYPLESEMLSPAAFSMRPFIPRCAEFRKVADYDICDSFMIADGYLQSKKDLILMIGMKIPEETLQHIVDFAKQRGRVWVRNDAQISVLHGDTTLDELARRQGCKLSSDSQPVSKGIYHFEKWPRLEPFASLPANGNEERYQTVHQNHISCYIPKRLDFEIRKRAK
ncbi:MAG: hypothetical protein JXM70_12575, partial [Pirellulales bacterium]|nr:hypothetical protein [Pirellulales bacterium]